MSEPGPGSGYSEDEIATVGAFREIALEMVRWHRERTDGFERRAANLLGLSGLALALLPFAVNNLTGLDRWARTSVRWATAVAAGAFFVAVLGSIQTLRPRKNATSAPETDQLQREWTDFKRDREWKAAGVRAPQRLTDLGDLLVEQATLHVISPEGELSCRASE